MACLKPADYAYGEHTADVLIQAYGCSLEEAFANAAVAVAELTYYTDRVKPADSRAVAIEHEDLEGLLFAWISEILYLFDGEKFALGRRISLKISGGGPYRLEGEAWGEKYDVNRHGFKGLIVKAMTYNMMSIRERGYWELDFVVDI
ncbi:MAG: archease [Thermoproteus sp. AZ2]|uniref:Archease n=1 Tax=Thermoproteus sp. AZ2 TaxID=1609232 RepID=A0ACC6V137_9CREN